MVTMICMPRPEPTTGTITSMLRLMRKGDPDAANELFAHVYDNLRGMAQKLLHKRGQPWNAYESAALVNAACERILQHDKLDAENRRHFYFLLSRAMRDALIEDARGDLAVKRGGRHRRVTLGDVECGEPTDTFAMDDIRHAIDALHDEDAQAAEVVMLRFFGGRSLAETAELMGCSFAIVRRDWEYARAWLHKRLSSGHS